MDIVDVIETLQGGDQSEPHSTCRKNAVGSDEHGVSCFYAGRQLLFKNRGWLPRPCAFCAIPLIKGTGVSRPVESILAEARILQDKRYS